MFVQVFEYTEHYGCVDFNMVNFIWILSQYIFSIGILQGHTN